MDGKYTLQMPKLGESIMNAVVVRWFKKEGDIVEIDEPLLEVSTDKVNSEIPSPVAGTLVEILAEVDVDKNVGEPIAIIALEGADLQSDGLQTDVPKASQEVDPEVEEQALRGEKRGAREGENFYSPAVIRLAQEHSLPIETLASIPHKGERLSRKELQLYIDGCSKPQGVERIKMSSMRKTIAENMVRSFYEAPHAALVQEIDVSSIVEFLQKEKEAFKEKWGVKLTITSFVAVGICRAIAEFPLINSSLDGDTIVQKNFVNLGIAVSVDEGVLVPVIRDCQAFSLLDFSKEIAVLSHKARSKTLSLEEMKEGTITMTNFGMTGALLGIPIIRYPEVAIIGVGALHKKVVPTETEGVFAARSFVNVSLTFDHRVLDGMYGCGFLAALDRHLSSPSFDSLT